MGDPLRLTRNDFLRTCGALTAGGIFGRPLLAADAPGIVSQEPVYLKAWELVEFPERKEKFRAFVKITASGGAVGYCRTLGGVNSLSQAEQAVAQINLLDHEKLYDVMVSKNVPSSQLKILDIACWDLHARMVKKPLHALLGTKKENEHRRHQLPADAGIREGSPTVGHQPALGLGPPRAPRDGL